ncbi:hypothetical protein GCM10027072_80160 [Streptomyces bullii]
MSTRRQWRDGSGGAGHLQRVAANSTFTKTQKAYQAWLNDATTCGDCTPGEGRCTVANDLWRRTETPPSRPRYRRAAAPVVGERSPLRPRRGDRRKDARPSSAPPSPRGREGGRVTPSCELRTAWLRVGRMLAHTAHPGGPCDSVPPPLRPCSPPR